MVKIILILCLILVACVPASLRQVPQVHTNPAIHSADLNRALSGATDNAAMRSLGQWIESNHDHTPIQSPPDFTVRFHPGAEGIFAPDYFNRLEFSGRFDPRGLTHHRQAGIGVPLAGFRENRGRELVEKWYPPEGITRAVTAVAIPGKSGQVEIRLIDRMHTDSIKIGGKKQTLAADFTVPFTRLLEKTGPLKASGINSVIRPKAERDAGFFLMEPYDPGRTPLILIHGLISTPIAWAELTNELWAVPEVQTRYQIWHYVYPTNPPALYSARIMRGRLDELRFFLDPQGNDPAMKRSVVIGHSMGGLLAKSLAVDPQSAFWDAVFTKPLASLDATPAERKTLKEAFFWKPRGNVDRIIFCSVPFRGSNIANSAIGKFATSIMTPSSEFQDFFIELEKKNPGMLQQDYASLTQGKITSVMALSPRQRSMEIFDQLPLTPDTSAHVITGSKDFVVQPSSSSFAGSESSIEVPAGHGSFHHPKAVAEIIRILELPDAR
jgi:pimeloyl-ACP methyl ester carboxylesterase